MLTEKRWKIVFWTCFCLTFGRSLSVSVPFTNLKEEQSSEISGAEHLEFVKTNDYSYSADRLIKEANELNSGANFYSYETFENGDAPKEVPNENTRFVPKALNADDGLNRTSYNNRIRNTAQGLEVTVRKTREADHGSRTLDYEPYFLADHESDSIPNKVNKDALTHGDETTSRIKDFDGFSGTKMKKRKEKSVRQAVAFIVTPESFASILKGGVNKNTFNLRDSKKLSDEKQPKNKEVFFTRDSSQDFKKRRKNSEDETRQWDYISSDINSRHNEDNRYIDDFESYDKVEEFNRREPFSAKSAPLVNEEKTDRFKKQFSSGFDNILLSAKLKIGKVDGKARPSLRSNLEKASGLRNEEDRDTFIEALTKSFDPILLSPKFLNGKKSMPENIPNRKSSERNHSKKKLKKNELDEYIREDETGSKYRSSSGIVDTIESSKRSEKMKKENFYPEPLKGNRRSQLKLTRRGDSDELSDLLNLLDLPANLNSEKIIKTTSKPRSQLQNEKISDKSNKINQSSSKNLNGDIDESYNGKNIIRNHGSQKIKNNYNVENKKSHDSRKEINYFSEDEQNSKENYFKDLRNKSILRDESQAKQDSNKDGCDGIYGQFLADDRDVNRIRCINLNKNDSLKNVDANSSYPEKYKSIVEKLNKNPNLISKFDFQLLNSSSLLKSDDNTDFPSNRNNEKKSKSKLFENLLQLHELTQANKKILTEKAHSSKEILSKEKNSSIALRENKEKSKARSKDRSNKSAITLAELINSYHDKGVEKDGGVTVKIPSRVDLGNIMGFASSTLRPNSFQDVTEGIKNISKNFSISPTKLPNFSKIESSNNITQFSSLPGSKSISSDSLQAVPLSISSLNPGGSPIFINSHVFVSSTPFPELLSQLDYVPRIRTPSSLSPNEISHSPGVHYHILPGILKGNHALKGLLEGDPISSSLLSGLNSVSNKGLIGINDPLQRLSKNNKFNSADVTIPSSFVPRTSVAFSNSSPFPTIPFSKTLYPTTPFPATPIPTTPIPTTPFPITKTPTALIPTTPYPTLHSSILRSNSPISTLSDNLHSPSPIIKQRVISAAALSPTAPSPTNPIFITHQPTTPFATSQHQSTPFPNFSRSTTPILGAISHVTSPYPASQHFPVTSFPSLLHPSTSLFSIAPHPVPFTTLSNSQSLFPHSAAPLTEFVSGSPFSHLQKPLAEVTKNLAPLNLNPKIQFSVTPITEVFNHSPSLIRSKPSFSTPSFTTNRPKQLVSAPLSPSIQKQRQTTNSRRLRARIKARERIPSLSPLIDSNIQTQVSIGPSIATRPGNLIKIRKKVRRKGRRPLGSQNSTEIASQVSLAISPIPKIVSALQDTVVYNGGPANTISNLANFQKQNLEAELTTLNELNKVASSDSNSKKVKDFSSFTDVREIRKRRPINKLRGKASNHASTTAAPTINISSTKKSFQSNLKKSLAQNTEEQISLISSINKSALSLPNSLKKTKLPPKTVPTIKKISAVPRVQNPTPPASHQVLNNSPPDRSRLKPLHSLNSITPVAKRKSQSTELLHPFVKHSSSPHIPGNSQHFDLNRQVHLQTNNDEYPSNIRFIPEEGIVNPASNKRFHHQFPGLSPNLAISDGLEIIPRNSFDRSFLFNSLSGVSNGQIGIPYIENSLPDLPRHQARTVTPPIEQGSYFIPNAGFDLVAERYPFNFNGGPTIIPVGRSVGFDSSLMTRVPPSLRKYYLQDV